VVAAVRCIAEGGSIPIRPRPHWRGVQLEVSMKFLPKTGFVLVAALFAVAVNAQDLTGTLKKIKDSGAIVLGTRESSGALAYTLGDGKYVGFHTEMGERIAKDIQRDLKMPKLDIKYQPVTSQNRIPLVQNGTVDLECGSTTNNVARQKDVSFAMTTYVEEGRIVVKANSPIKGIADLNGKTVATTTGTTSVQTLRKNKRAANMDFKEVFGKDHSDSFLLLESGRADAFVMDGQILAGLVSKAKNPSDYKILGEVLSVEPIACMIRKDDPAFKTAVDNSIKAMVKSGELAKMYDKWFMQPIPPSNTKVGLPLSDATKQAWANPNDKPMEEYAAP
jgi:glutamate/aspartate transport system substrate-binding protein